MVVGQTAPEHDGFQVEFFAQFLAVFVHAPRQTQSPVVGMDEDLDAVEDVTLAGVGVESVCRFASASKKRRFHRHRRG